MLRRTTALIAGSALAIAGGITAAVIWLSQPSYDEIVKDCQKALAAQSKAGGKGKPSACKDVKEDDYDVIVISNAIDSLPEKDKDILDYYDDGTLNDSLDGD